MISVTVNQMVIIKKNSQKFNLKKIIKYFNSKIIMINNHNNLNKTQDLTKINKIKILIKL